MKATAATILVAIAAALGLASDGSSPLPTPETPFKQQINALLAAINTGDRETIRRFVAERFEPPREGILPVDEITGRYLDLYNSTRGIDLRRVAEVSNSKAHALGQTRLTKRWIKIQVFFGTTTPTTATCQGLPRIAGLVFRTTEISAELLTVQRTTASLVR